MWLNFWVGCFGSLEKVGYVRYEGVSWYLVFFRGFCIMFLVFRNQKFED